MANGTGKLDTAVMILATVVLVGFAGLLWYLFSISSGANETLWNRSIFLYGGVEALAFAAAGFLFGKEVHRKQAENAEKRADQKTQEAEASGKDAAAAKAKGQSLSKAVAAKLAPSSGRSEVYESLVKGTPDVAHLLAKGDLEEISRLARELFPD